MYLPDNPHLNIVCNTSACLVVYNMATLHPHLVILFLAVYVCDPMEINKTGKRYDEVSFIVYSFRYKMSKYFSVVSNQHVSSC